MKIIRNIDGKKLELTLTNEEAMSVFKIGRAHV